MEEVSVLPDEIGVLVSLRELCVSSNMLAVLPDSIGRLTNLETLDVSCNKLNSLPDGIWNCRSLVELDASCNELTSLPAPAGMGRNLPSLRVLDAHFNRFRRIPASLHQLSDALEVLNLRSNSLQELPGLIGALQSLRLLDLSNNELTRLPDSFAWLRMCHYVNLERNPLVIPPREIADQGSAAVVDYMAERYADILANSERTSMMIDCMINSPLS